ncbi:hypothetical protein QE152_g27236 [Popillia japonica]|uniref:Uncharacterized protein n=1 Tax=Popillia japonica TaxID=7064 RepID=A0AAW1JTU7_POPJA
MDWQDVYTYDVNVAYECFIDTLKTLFWLCFPLRRFALNSTAKNYWMTDNLRSYRETYNLICDIHRQYPHLNLKEQVHNYKIFYTKKIQDTRKAYNDRFIKNSDNKSKAVWAVVKTRQNNIHKDIILQHNGHIIKTQQDVANTFNNFFVSIGSSTQHITNISDTSQVKSPDGSFFFQPVTKQEIIAITSRDVSYTVSMALDRIDRQKLQSMPI